LRYSNETNPLRIVAGPYTDPDDNAWLPAKLELYHNKYADTDHRSSFAIHVSQLRGDAHIKHTTTLRGKPNGELTWDTKNIVRSVNNRQAVANGNVTIEITDISGLNASLNNKYDSTDFVIKNNTLSSNISDNKNVPTCKSVVDWCNTNFLKSVGFEDPTDAIDMLQSMLY
jgi:hypothetical protein